MIVGVVLLTAGVGPCESQEARERDNKADSANGSPAEIQPEANRVPEVAPQAPEQQDLARIAATLEAMRADQNSKAEQDRAERDLGAQEEMARWALPMLVAAALQALIGAIGIWYIRKTLKINTATAQDQVRAYLMTKDVFFHIEENRRVPNPHPVVRLNVVNSGNSPTRETEHCAWLAVRLEAKADIATTITIRDGNRYRGRDISPNGGFDTWSFDFEKGLLPPEPWVDTPELQVRAKVLATYRDVFGRPHEEAFFFKSNMPAGWKLGSKVELRPDSETWDPEDGYNTN